MAEMNIIQAPCNDCGRKTDHVILKTHKTAGRNSEDGTHWDTTFSMIECCGCHFISLKRTFNFSEYDGPETEYFPPPVSRRKPSWIHELVVYVPEFAVCDLLDEVYSALHSNSRRLAAMGSRTLLDMAIVDSVGDVGTFADKLEALQQKGIIGKIQQQFLEAALEAGNAAAHRGHCPTAQRLQPPRRYPN